MGSQEVVKEWISDGHKCKIVKNKDGSGKDRHFCGYVRTTLSVRHGLINSLVDVHGGITYGADDDGWFGFDFAHAGDVCIDETGRKMIEPVANPDNICYEE